VVHFAISTKAASLSFGDLKVELLVSGLIALN
jgi:hypothetical protein